MKLNISKRDIKFWWQRVVHDFDDSETWSLDVSLAKLILPRLKRFKEITIGIPADKNEGEWNNDLDKMIAAFEWYASEKCFDWGDPQLNKNREMADEGIKLFAENYNKLWW